MIPLAFLLRHRRAVAGVYLLLILASLPGIWRLGLDNSPEVFFVGDEREVARYERFRETFGTDDTLRVVFSGPGLWRRQGLAWAGEVERGVAGLEGVGRVVGLEALHRWHLLGWPPPEPQLFRRELAGSSLDVGGGWVAPGAGAATLLVELEDLPKGEQRRLLNEIEGILEGAPAGVAVALTGLAVVERALDRSLLDMAARFLPLLALLVVALLAVVLRQRGAAGGGSGPGSLAPLLLVAACLAPVLGAMGYLGVPFNVVTVILVPLLFVIGLATGIHVLLRFRRQLGRGLSPGEAVLATYEEEAWAVFWTGVSTFVGFGSLVTSGAEPIRSLGAWAAAGLAFMTLTAFTLYPALLAGARGAARSGEHAPRGFEAVLGPRGRAWARRAVDRRRVVYAGAALVAAMAAAGIPRLEVESSALTYLPADHPVRVELEAVQAAGLGAVTLELVLERDDEGGDAPEPGTKPGFRDPESLEKLLRLSRSLRREPGVAAALGAGDLMEEAIRRTVVGEAPSAVDGTPAEVDENVRWLVLGLLQSDPEGRRLLAALAPPPGESARISLLIPMLGFHDLEPLAGEVLRRAEQVFPSVRSWVTGRYLLVVEGQRLLLTSLVTSLGLTVGCIGAMFWWLLGSSRFAFRMLLPNLLPPLVVLGVMGWAGVPLDSSTVIIAAVVLGLVVDDTLHSLGHFRRLVPRLGDREAALATLERTAPAHLLTSVLLVAGFGICGLSELVPIARFGVLAALAILVALVADLLLVPALLASSRG